MAQTCDICGRNMIPATWAAPVRKRNCGGTCLECMADAGDPDCIRALRDSGEVNHAKPPTLHPLRRHD